MTRSGHLPTDRSRTVRRRLRRVALVAGLPLALAACGGGSDDAAGTTTTSLPDLPIIRVGDASSRSSGAGLAGAPEAASADAAMTADKMIAPLQRFVFEAAPGLPALDAPATVYRFDASGVDVPARLAAIAARLGVTGEVRELPAEQGGGWQVGSADGTGPAIYAGGTGMLDWGYSSNDPGMGYACPGSEDGQPVDCPEPTPPEGVPTADEARASAEALFTELGVDLSQYQLDVSADEWGAWVAANLLVDGSPSGAAWSLSYGGNGVLQYVGGFLATPVAVGDYPTIGTAAAVTRLQEQQDRWYGPVDPLVDPLASDIGQSGDTPVADAAAPAVEDPPATTAPAPSDSVVTTVPAGGGVAPETVAPEATPVPETVPVESVVPETAPPPDATPVETVPGETVPVDTTPVETLPPLTVTLTGVTPRLQMVWDVDGVVWLVPAYGFTTDDGGLWEVLAIADGYIDLGDTTMPIPLAAAEADPAAVEPGISEDSVATEPAG
jgi:hypothetical protein